jgi:hypothetical protein
MTNTAEAILNMAKIMENFSNQMSNVITKINPEEQEIEEVKPYYVNPNFKFNLPQVYRMNQDGMRYYFTVKYEESEEAKNLNLLNEDKTVVSFYPSVTTIIDKVVPKSFAWMKLISELGMKGFYQMMREKAKYGTLLHILIADYFKSADNIQDRYFDFNTIAGRVALYIEENRITFDTHDWIINIKKDLAGIIQFIKDYEIEPIAIELMGLCEPVFNNINCRFGGAIDLICEMTVKEKGFYGEVYKSGEKKGEPKETTQERRIRAIIDFKSGKSGFFDDYEIQLHLYKMMIENLNLGIERVYNVAPSEWIKNPNASMKDQTDSKKAMNIPEYLTIFHREWISPKEFLLINGTTKGLEPLSEICKFVPAEEYVLNRFNKKNKQKKVNPIYN